MLGSIIQRNQISFTHRREIESRDGIHTIEASADLNIGSREYELINID